jgi:arsenate reductase (thioredoxin)
MNETILKTIKLFSEDNIIEERRLLLQPLIDYIQRKKDSKTKVFLIFICTHNSRRSHLSQIWAQTMAYHFGINNVYCYSGGTEATATFPLIVETLIQQGFQIQKLSSTENPVFMVKYSPNESPIICFSKQYNHDFNPKNNFGAILTCNGADESCPIVFGAEERFPIKYNDPKIYDNTALRTEKYIEKSIEIGQEMFYVFSKIK